MPYVKNIVLLTSFVIASTAGYTQDTKSKTTEAEKPQTTKNATPDLKFDPDATVVTYHTVTINGKAIPYKATAGTLPVWDADGKAIAGVFFVYYERTDIKDKSSRPLTISFNGGPGSASVWMHIGYTGPVFLNIDDEGYPVQPYGYTANQHSILDATDIVYVDPVNTGFSRIVGKDVAREKFFGVNADIKYLGDWVNSFVNRYDRWASPKFLIGESYGTTRVSGLALELQQSHWIYLNGVVLVSPTDLGIERGTATDAALLLPYYAATAWYHKKQPSDLLQKDLTAMLPEVESFTMNELIPALNKGSLLDDATKQTLAAKMARYSGMPEKVILQNNLSVNTNLFWKELLRNEGFTIGRLDSRYRGIDKQDAGNSPDFNAELTAWLHAFTPPINMYLKTNWAIKPTSRTICSVLFIPGTIKAIKPVRTCDRQWLPILTCMYWYSLVITTAPVIISMPNTTCGRWIHRASLKTG
ncbi:carboxypeptidase [Niabella defluvii]|nr:carboxypeptidase [Niabella sp. I65]